MYFPAAPRIPPSLSRNHHPRAVERFDQILPTALGLLAPASGPPRLALLIRKPQLPPAQAVTPRLHWLPIPIPQSERKVVAIARLMAENI